MSDEEMVVHRETQDSTFEFDKIYGQLSTQQEVFSTVAPLIISSMDGFNTTIFAYGQTGSGLSTPN